MIRAKVKKVASDAACIVEIDSVPMARGHTYRKGDIVPCRRTVNEILRSEQWEVVSERELNLAEAAERFERDERDRAEQEKEAKRAHEAPQETPVAAVLPPSEVEAPRHPDPSMD